MYALILAGGKGERLRPLTDSLPKPLVPLDSKPILWHQVEWLKQAGVTNVIFLVGYRWEMVREYFGDGSGFGIRPVYSVETRPLGRGGAIRLGLAHVPEEEETVFVLNGDIITDQDPTSLLNHHVSRKRASADHLATIMVVPMVSPYGLVDLDENSDVVGFREKVALPHWINAGVYVFDRAIGPLMPELGDHEDHTFPGLAREGRISAYRSNDFWRSVDSLKDLREAEDHVREAQAVSAAGAQGSTQ
ncbi:MAG: nucleotidyltransferase family protein [Chloroflexota bacterium]|nr:nucleotidyltransferase family protein [Chloroflexota bacterium]